MIVRITTDLDASAEKIWALLRRKRTFLHVTRGVIGIRDADDWPTEQREGMVMRGRLWIFHVVPIWVHEINVESVDEHRREARTSEHGGPVQRWQHLLKVEPLADGRTRYTDEVTIDAGVLTPLVWVFAHGLYRYRHKRWRSLAKVIS